MNEDGSTSVTEFLLVQFFSEWRIECVCDLLTNHVYDTYTLCTRYYYYVAPGIQVDSSKSRNCVERELQSAVCVYFVKFSTLK
jgi:hypothetical protein